MGSTSSSSSPRRSIGITIQLVRYSLLTVRLPRFLTRQFIFTVLPTRPVMLVGMVVSKMGPPVPGVGRSCKKSVKNRFEAPSELPASAKKQRVSKTQTE